MGRMQALLRKAPGARPWTVLAIAILCLVIGSAIPIFAESMRYQPGRLAALPAMLLLGMLLVYDHKMLLMLILLLRTVGDIALESTAFGIGDTSMGIGGLINLVVIMIAFMMVLKEPHVFPRQLARYWAPVLVMMGIGVVTSYEKSGAIKTYLGMLSNFAIFIVAVYTVRSSEDFNKAIRLVMWSSLLPSIFSIVDVAMNMRGGSFRLHSTFAHANIMAFYLTLVLVLCLYMLKSPLFGATPSGRVLICCYIPVLLGQLLLTQTRSAWLACLIIFVVYALIFERKYLLYLLVLPLAVVLVPSVQDRLMELDGGDQVLRYAPLNSFAWRVVLWKSAYDWMEPARLVYGYGLDDFGHFSRTFFAMDHTHKLDAHNVYMQFVFEIGVVGLLSYLWLYGQILRAVRAFARIDRVSGFLLVAIVVQYLIVSFSDNLFRYLVFNWYFWFIVGGACSIVELQAGSRQASARTPVLRTETL